MIREREWDEEGRSAAHADEVALIPREAVLVSYEEREERNYWRQVASNRPRERRGGSDSHRHGYLAPGSGVPGVTPGYATKGDKGEGKGGKSYGKRTRSEYESGSSWGWGRRSSGSRQSWWDRSSWSNWSGWNWR